MLAPCCCAALLLCFALPSHAQSANQSTSGSPQPDQPANTVRLTPRSAEQRDQASRQSHNIVLNVSVTDAAGNAVANLSESDFTVLDNGAPQKITYVRPAQPAHLILLLDAVNSSRRTYDAERKALEKYLTQSHAALALPTAIGWLAGSRIALNPESRDRAVLLGQIAAAPDAQPIADPPHIPETNSGGEGATAGSLLPVDRRTQKVDLGWSDQNRRFMLSVEALTNLAIREQNTPGRIVVIWLGAGWPLLTGPGFSPDSAAQHAGFFARIADLSGTLRDSQVILNAVASPAWLRDARLPDGYYAPLLSAVTTPDQASAAHLALPVLAVHSGGQVLDSNQDIAAAISGCIAGIDSWYLLSFQSTPSSLPDEYRPLQVKVSNPALRVRTSTGYYAQP